MEATGGKGVEIVLESVSGEIGDACFRMLAPFGRLVLFGAKNIHDTFDSGNLQQLIRQNQSVTGFNLPALRPEQIAEHAPRRLRHCRAATRSAKWCWSLSRRALEIGPLASIAGVVAQSSRTAG